MDTLLLPTGHVWDLHIERHRAENAGAFTGGGCKFIIHTTESKWESVDAMVDVLVAKRAAPHLVIGGRPGVKHPVVVQMIPFHRAARALANDGSDSYQTNRANAWQIEICGYAKDSQDWPVFIYKALANVFELLRHRVPIPCVAPQDFSNPIRMSDAGFVKCEGILGHSMVPDNNHWDPGRFREGLFLDLVHDMPGGGWDL